MLKKSACAEATRTIASKTNTAAALSTRATERSRRRRGCTAFVVRSAGARGDLFDLRQQLRGVELAHQGLAGLGEDALPAPLVFGEAHGLHPLADDRFEGLLVVLADRLRQRLVRLLPGLEEGGLQLGRQGVDLLLPEHGRSDHDAAGLLRDVRRDRKSTRLNSSHVKISYAVFCLKK